MFCMNCNTVVTLNHRAVFNLHDKCLNFSVAGSKVDLLSVVVESTVVYLSC